MERQLLISIPSAEEGEHVRVTNLTERDGFVMLTLGDARIAVDATELRKALDELEKFNG